MLEWYHWTLIGMAASAAILAWNVPRALLWLGLGAASYVTSAMWHNAGLPFATHYGAATNVVIFLLLFKYAQTWWEMKFWPCITLMLLIDLLYVTGVIKTQEAFGIALEVVNAIAILLIGATGLTDRINAGAGNHNRGSPYRAWASALHRTLFAKRERYPRWWSEP